MKKSVSGSSKNCNTLSVPLQAGKKKKKERKKKNVSRDVQPGLAKRALRQIYVDFASSSKCGHIKTKKQGPAALCQKSFFFPSFLFFWLVIKECLPLSSIAKVFHKFMSTRAVAVCNNMYII